MNCSPSKLNGLETAANTERILESLFLLLPVFHKKLLKMDWGDAPSNLTRLHFGVMGITSKGSRPVSEIARIMGVSKPQMTHVVDLLVELSLLERCPDTTDRRIINLALTDKGYVLLKDMKIKAKENLRNKLAGLTAEELSALSEALETLRRIGDRL